VPRIFALLAVFGFVASPLTAADDAAHVRAYRVVLDVRLRSGSVSGRARLTVDGGNADSLVLDAGDIVVDRVLVAGKAVAIEKTSRQVVIPLARARRRQAAIDIRYHAEPRRGMRFLREREEVYTIFSTSEWLPCVDAPSERATLDLEVRFDVPVVAVGSGEAVEPVAGAATRFHWIERRPVSTYAFGFAAGHYASASRRHGRTALRFLGTGFSSADLQTIFADTGDMLDFFERRATVPYPHRTYTQVLTNGNAEQEVDRLTLLNGDYGRSLLADRTDDWLLAHEFAHQWWGIGLTCATWGDFWLNEGLATFMADAYKEHRFGRDAYDREIAESRKRYERVRDAGNDHPLTYASWTSPSPADRVIVYHKGAYVLHLLREQLGEDPFWRGIAAYTREHMGRSVTTVDFQRSMEAAAGVDLSAFFQRWVY
jgi:aminopeptidase N